MAESTVGRLLVGSPAIRDGIFDQAVVFMLHHDPAGALGVVLSSPTELAIDELLPRWSDLCAEPGVVFDGGPVEPNGFVGLGRIPAGSVANHDQAIVMPIVTDAHDGRSRQVDPEIARVGTVDLEADPAVAAASVDRLRIFRGFSGWGPGQLEGELVRGAWFTVEAIPNDLWHPEPTTLYERVLRRQPGELKWFANAPTDPSVN